MIDVNKLNKMLGPIYCFCERGWRRFNRGEATTLDLDYAAWAVALRGGYDEDQADRLGLMACDEPGVAEALVAEFYYEI